MRFKLLSISALLILLLSSLAMQAQDERLNELQFDSTETKEEAPPYFAISGGFTVNFLMTNFGELNKIAKSIDLPDMGGAMMLYGGQGFTAIGLIRNVRAGFFSMGGAKLSEKNVILPNGKTGKHSLEFYTSLNGINIDYAYVPFKNFAIIPGINLGWGFMTIENFQAENSIDWKDNSIGKQDTLNYLNRIRTGYWFAQPTVNLEYAITQFSMLRASVGYNLSFADSWTFNRNATLNNVPTGMNANGLAIQVGIFLGVFGY